MNITRRNALLAGAAALTTGAIAAPIAMKSAGVKAALAGATEDPLVSLWQERIRLRAQLDRLSDQCDAIEETLPEWARNFDGIMIQVPGCKPRTCRTTEQIDAVMRRRALFSLDPPSKTAVSAWRVEGKSQRDTWVMELAGMRQRYDRERELAGYTAKEEEYEAIWPDIDRIEDQIVDTQAVTVEGLLVQALFFAELQEDEEQQFYDARLAKSMGIAARRMAPGLVQAEHLAGGMPS
jgi:hypothetical protein